MQELTKSEKMSYYHLSHFYEAYYTSQVLKEEVANLIAKTENEDVADVLKRINQKITLVKEDLEKKTKSLEESLGIKY